MDVQGVKKVLASDVGRPLKEYLQERLEELRNIETLREIDTPTHLAIEVKSQKKAFLKLREILKFIMDVEEEQKPKSPADSYVVE